ncbi:MAG TPA: hypothetical protein PK593_00015 [Thermomicrobiales bacterium]|nr:hypothetical protein [Thermomicrobiales bacterium]
MTRWTSAELAAEQLREADRWADGLRGILFDAANQGDYATIAYLHKALARVMGNYQRFRDAKGGEAATDNSRAIDH